MSTWNGLKKSLMACLEKNTVFLGLICLLAACGQTPTSEQLAPVQQSQHALTTQSILLVTGSTTLTPEDVLLKQRLETLVPTVVVVDHNATSAAATGHSMVLISASVDNLILTNKFRDVAVPVMLLKRVLVNAMGMATTSNASSSANTMELFGFAGLASPLTLTSASTPISYVSSMAPGAVIRARRFPDVVPNRITAFSIETGAAMITGPAPARRMFWPGLVPTIPLLTTAGWQFFDESVKWTLGGLGDSECKGKTNGTACNDDNACTTGDACNNGYCTTNTPVVCNDNNACTTNTCIPATGCSYPAVTNGTSCADTNLCNGTESCQSGQCTGSAPLNCDDGNPCTTDSCGGTDGCAHLFVPGPGCAAPALLVVGANTAPADDELLRQRLVSLGFSVQLVNDTAVTAAQANAASLVVISESTLSTNVGTRLTGISKPLLTLEFQLMDELRMSSDFTSGNIGTATIVNASHPAANGQSGIIATTVSPQNHSAAVGLATGANVIATLGSGSPFMVAVENGATLIGGNATSRMAAIGYWRELPTFLTTAGWALFDGAVRWLADPRCAGIPNGGTCNDGDACQLNDLCQDGVCKGQPLVCTDNNVCNGIEACQAGTCSTGSALNCDDGDPCTAESCDAISGCGHTYVIGPSCPLSVLFVVGSTTLTSSDQSIRNRLTGLGLGVTVVDHNAPASAATNRQMVLISPSTSATTLGNRYASATVPVMVMNAGLYDDMLMGAQGGSYPSTGLTISTPAHPTAAGLTGTVAPVPTTTSVAATTSVASGATVVARLPTFNYPAIFAFNAGSTLLTGTAPARRLGWFGTTSAMTALTTQGVTLFNKAVEWTIGGFGDAQCLGQANGTTCNDGNACSAGDSCQGSFCVAGAAVSCDDGNVCTTDSCVAASGCAHTNVANGTSCQDGNGCNGIESCQQGSCTPGIATVCDDGNVCTTNSCHPTLGCQYQPLDGIACADQNVCNGSEQCVMGVCAGGGALSCDDGNACTVDSCDAEGGCRHTPGTGSGCKRAIYVAYALPDYPRAVVQHLEQMGFGVTVTNQFDFQAIQNDPPTLLVVGETAFAGTFGSNAKQLNAPVMVLKQEVFDEFGMAGSASNRVYYSPTADIVAPQHPAVGGLSGVITYTTQPGFRDAPDPVLDAIVLARTPHVVAAVLEKGTFQNDWSLAPQRRGLMTVLSPASTITLTPQGWQLFTGMINWLIAPPGCANSPDGTQCNDQDACTTGDVCTAGTCVGQPNAAGCALIPEIACVSRGSYSMTVYYGYTNPGPTTVLVPKGPENRFVPYPWDWNWGDAQLTSFAPGRHQVAMEKTFFSTGDVTWTLGNTQVSTVNAPLCCSDVLPVRDGHLSSGFWFTFAETAEYCRDAWRTSAGDEVSVVTDQAWGTCRFDSGRVLAMQGANPKPARSSWFNPQAVQPGIELCIEAMVKWTGGKQPYVGVVGMDEHMTVISTMVPVVFGMEGSDRYERRSGRFTVPAGTHFVQFEIGTGSAPQPSKPGVDASFFDDIVIGECRFPESG